MSTPEVTVQVSTERAAEWQRSLHDLFDGFVQLEEMPRPRGLGTYIEGYDADFDSYRTSLSKRELTELNQYLGNIGTFCMNRGRDSVVARDKHPSHTEIIRPIRYLHREMELYPVEDLNPDQELPNNLYMRIAERRFDGVLHARFWGRTFTFSQEKPVYEASIYTPTMRRQALSLALAFHPVRNSLALTRVVLHQPRFTDQPSRTIEPLFDDLLQLFHVGKNTNVLIDRSHREAHQHQAS